MSQYCSTWLPVKTAASPVQGLGMAVQGAPQVLSAGNWFFISLQKGEGRMSEDGSRPS